MGLKDFFSTIDKFFNPDKKKPSAGQPIKPENDAKPENNGNNNRAEQQGGEEASKQTPPPQQEINTDSAPEIRATVVQNTNKLLKNLLGKDDFTGTVFYVESSSLNLILDKTFEDQLRLMFDNSGFNSLANGTLKIYSNKKAEPTATDVYMNKVFVELLTAKTSVDVPSQKAKVSVAYNKGSLKQAEYLIDTAAGGKTVYKIGRGDFSTKNGVPRQNDIVINDAEPDAALADLNKYVSSSHANIELTNGNFYLHAMISGISGGNATKIIREGSPNPIKLETDKTLYPLKNGDIIELGRSVMLKFEIL